MYVGALSSTKKSSLYCIHAEALIATLMDPLMRPIICSSAALSAVVYMSGPQFSTGRKYIDDCRLLYPPKERAGIDHRSVLCDAFLNIFDRGEQRGKHAKTVSRDEFIDFCIQAGEIMSFNKSKVVYAAVRKMYEDQRRMIEDERQ
jgi:hypothetical protein